jgi:putative flippase GtrA
MKLVREVGAFIVVGVASTITHYAVAMAIFYGLEMGWGALWTNFVAFCVAFMVTYFGNALFVFPETRLGPRSFFRFLAVSLLSLSLNQGIIYVLVEIQKMPYWQALIIALMIVPMVSFLTLKFWGVKTR